MKLFKIIILVTIALGVFAFFYWRKKSTDEMYILPDNFTGPVLVLFNAENGVPEKFNSDGERVFEIPESGILKTKFKFQEAFRNIRYIRKNGKELRYLWPVDNAWKDTFNKKIADSVYVFKAGYATNYWFIVGRIRDLDSLSIEMSKKWEQLSKPVKLNAGDSLGKVRHNKAF